MEENKDLMLTADDRDYTEELLTLIKSGKKEDIETAFADYHENDIADVLELLTEEERTALYKTVGAEAMSEIFPYLEDVGEYLSELDDGAAADIIENMDADDAVEVLDELEEEERNRLIDLLEPEAKEDIDLIYSYEDDEFGSIMTTNFVTVGREMTVQAAMKSLIEQAAENDNISTIFLTEPDGSLYGAIDLKDLIIARKGEAIEDLAITSFPFVYDTEKIDENLGELREYEEDSIPVISSKTREMLGVITAQHIVEAAYSEMGEDYAMLAGLTGEEDLKEPLIKSLSKRVPWLTVLLFLGLAISSVVGLFEGMLKSLTVIVCFQSLILNMAGNTGTQSLAVTIRTLGEEELSFKQKMGLVVKELKIGFTGGIIMGAISFFVVSSYIYFFKSGAWGFSFAAGSCVALSLCVAMTISNLIGTVTPMLFKKIGIDPAVASGPLITTVNDLVAVITYYGLAYLLLINLLAY